MLHPMQHQMPFLPWGDGIKCRPGPLSSFTVLHLLSFQSSSVGLKQVTLPSSPPSLLYSHSSLPHPACHKAPSPSASIHVNACLFHWWTPIKVYKHLKDNSENLAWILPFCLSFIPIIPPNQCMALNVHDSIPLHSLSLCGILHLPLSPVSTLFCCRG